MVPMGLALVAGMIIWIGSVCIRSDRNSVPAERSAVAAVRELAPQAVSDGRPYSRIAANENTASLKYRDSGADRGQKAKPDPFGGLEKSEQQSLHAAFRAARLAVQLLTSRESEMERNQGVRLFASNPGQKLTARFLDGAVRIESGRGAAWAGTFRFVGEIDADTGPMVSAIGDNRVEYAHPGGVTEWYTNRADGIEHGFSMRQRPPSAADTEEMCVEIALTGLTARPAGPVAPNGVVKALEFVDPATGAAVLHYGGLKVWDNTGRELPARMTAGEGTFSLMIADAGASYPITIDPLFVSQEAKLGPDVTGDGRDNDRFGNSVALSGDTAIIGAYREGTPTGLGPGSAYIFVRNGTLWTQQAKLRSSDGASGYFGFSVAIAGDTALVGESEYNSPSPYKIRAGRAHVFVRSGTVWTQQAILVANDSAGDDRFGSSVALSGDTALIGAPGFNREGAYVFVRNGTVWSQQARLISPDWVSHDGFATSVSLDGDTAVLGAPNRTLNGNGLVGGAYVFVRSGTSWSYQARLDAADAAIGDQFGVSVAISGETVLAGAWCDDTSTITDHGSAYAFLRSGTTWSQQAKLTASDGERYDYFGWSVALAGNTAVVGSPRADTSPKTDHGSAYVFLRNGTAWSQQAKLTASDSAASDQFGYSVAISGDTVLSGAYLDDTEAGIDAGSAYVFQRTGTTWSQQAKLTAGDGAANDQFGTSVGISGDTAVVGVPNDDTAAGSDTGSAYVFVRSGIVWTRQAKLTASDARVADHFGSAVAVSGDSVVVGAPYNNTTGSMYVFVRTGTVWSEQAKLTASDARSDDELGTSVALSGDTAVAGAPTADTSGKSNTGSAYVFVRTGTTWSQQAKLIASDSAAEDVFGWSVAISGDSVLVGSIYDDTPAGTDAGSAYVFVRSGTTWSQQAKLTASDALTNDNFGWAVSISGDTALIGANSGDSAAVPDTGSAYVFVRNGTTWSQQAKLTAGNAAGGDRFGASVGLSGDTCIVGAAGVDTSVGSNVGCAYVFSRTGTTWSEQVRLTSDEPAANDVFGNSVAISGDTAIVGNVGDDSVYVPTGDILEENGGAFVFRLSSSNQPPSGGNQPPSGGTMAILPLTTVDPSATFTVEFSGWADPDLPVSYAVYLDNVLVSSQGASASRIITAPTATGSHTLRGRISDGLGVFTELTQSFTVNTPIESWRMLHFGSPANSGIGADDADPDGDGHKNLFEFVAGLLPKDPSSRFRIRVEPTTGQPTRKSIIFGPIVPGRTYKLKYTDSLVVPIWQDIFLLPGSTSDNGAERTVIDPTTGLTRRYYRVEIKVP